MDKAQTLEKLCEITNTVGVHFKLLREHDCFCEHNPLGHQATHTDITDFICEAVKEKIAREKMPAAPSV